MSVQIIIDSTSDIMPADRSKYHIVPLTVLFGSEEYVDGITISREEFYEKLVKSDTLPTTSQASPAAFMSLFEEIVAAGDTAVVITLSSTFSGTYQSATIAAADFPGKVYVVDSRTAAMGSGILAEYALTLSEQGKTAAEIAEILEQRKKDIHVVALLDTLEYLKKGGRISAAVAFAGGVLSIKPVLSIEDGVINLLGKARGLKQGNNLLGQEIQKAGGVDFSMPVLLGYSGFSDDLLLKYIEDSAPLWKNGTDSLRYTLIGSVVGTHIGPGAVAVAFFKQS